MSAGRSRREPMPATIEEVVPEQQPALEDLYRAHSGRILQVAYRITGRMSDAEDALQTVFLRLAGMMGKQRMENTEAYFRRAAANAALDILRSRNVRGEIDMDDDEDFLSTVGSRR